MGSNRLFFDHLVIGSGVAGLSTALRLGKYGTVAVLTKKEINNSNTNYAQGGIACVVDNEDSYYEHLKDTLYAGAEMCDEGVARKIIMAGPSCVNDLIRMGTHFTTRGEMGESDKQKDYHLGMEGGHKKRRILHSGDITGNEIQKTLINACKRNSNIKIFENHAAIDLITSWRLGWIGDNFCLGAYVLDTELEEVKTFLALTVTLATGGAGKVYLYTSNPDVACGGGIAMGYRANAHIANMEFFQFHPTILYSPTRKNFLISEAVRGEGGILKIRDSKGNLTGFMHKYHKMQSLAPRDIVARAIDNELKRTGHECVFIDIRGRGEDFFKLRFPGIYKECLLAGIDMNRDPIPVVPAAHYCCGGIKTDINGYTGINGLYAVGETACNGFHGANRLASNSLLEALVVPSFLEHEISVKLNSIKEKQPTGQIPDWKTGNATNSDELVVIHHNWDEIRRFMWDYVGICRTNKRLERAKTRIRNIRKEIERYYWDFLITLDLVELRDLSTVAEIIIDSALLRKESRGLHFNADYPRTNKELNLINTVVSKPHAI